MTCRCSSQFCYLCGKTWKECPCRQWDEERLVAAGQQQVVNQFGLQRVQANPLMYAQRAQDAADRLRANHECRHTAWRKRNTGGRCENCHNFLGLYLLVSRYN